MAETFPDSITYLPNKTEGEIRIFSLLKDVLKPDEEFVVWYEPKISTKQGNLLYPDFIVWGQSIGLIILEIKDWSNDQIVEADINFVKLKQGNKINNYNNPERQARDYMNKAMENLKKNNNLITQNGNHKGHLKFPCNYGVIFPNITRNEFETNLSKIITAEKVLTADDILKIENGNTIILTSYLRKGRLFSFDALSPVEMDTLRGTLFKKIVIPQNSSNNNQIGTIKVLDKTQEQEAFKIGPGHRIIKGVAGSGKTLLIAYRAKILKLVNPNYKILIICYNITLRNYIKNLLQNIYKESNTDIIGIDIFHFHEYAINTIKQIPNYRNIIDPLYPKPKETWEDYQKRISSALINNLDKIPKGVYDAILIDECQDLTTDFIKFLLHLLNPNTNHLMIAIDPAQNLYGGQINWNSIGVQARGRVKNLKVSYRNTREILDLALNFRPNNVEIILDNDSPQALFPELNDRHGEKPILNSFNSNEDLINFIVTKIKQLQSNYSFSEIGILYQSKKFDYFNSLKDSLSNNNIPFEEIESQNDKLNFDINSNTIKLMNIYNVKGYEFKLVFLLNLENIYFNTSEMRNLIYVGITRAQETLIIPYLSNGKYMKYINEIKSILQN